MFLDDVENRPEGYLNGELRKIKAIRAVAHDLIDFMKQFEDFQKKLWLKKKFVVETNWCITLDRIPEEFYPEIAACDAQREEWVKLFAIDEIGGDLHEPKYSEPLSRSFLQANTGLFLNTIFFTEKFKQNIIAGFSDLDSDVEGSLFNSENYQAMNFFKRRYHESIKTIFIDPPYNTGGDGFAYKDSYKHSSWLSFMHDRGQLAKQLLSDNGTFTFSIDEIEAAKAWELFRGIFGPENFATDFVWEKKKKPSFLHRNIGKLNDYIFTFTRDYKSTFPFSVESTTEGKKTPLNNAGNNLGVLRFRSQSVRFNIPDGVIHAQDMSEGNIKTKLLEDVEIVNGTNSNELVLEGEWRYSQAKLDEVISESGELYISKVPFRPNHIKSGGEIKKMKNIMSPIHYKMETNEDATSQIEDLFGSEMFKNPKPEKLIRYLLKGTTYQSSESHLILDFFAGSGTTGHAVLNLNRDDRNNRRVVLVEMGEHFDTVLIPRLMKAAYSTTWNQGKPASRTTNVPFAFKYIRLESYEDTLNNLALTDQSPDLLGQPRELQDEYLLRYCLDTETSESLLDCEQFKDPFNYQLKIYDRESGEAKPTKVDLPETFNYLLGLKVRTMQMKEETLVIEGENPAAETVLVIWRNVESMDNKKLDKFVSKTLRINTADTEYAAIYINGDTTLNDPHKKILLTEQVFHDLMFDVEDV